MKRIETERLILRGFAAEDLMDFYEYAHSPGVGPRAGWKPHESIEESKKILGIFIREDNVFALELKATGKVIGSVGIHEDNIRAGAADCKLIGYVLSEQEWGKGLMPEAVNAVLSYLFDDMKCRLVSVQHYTSNLQSRRVIEKCGFTSEGTLAQGCKHFNGTFPDGCTYSMTRREYFIKKAENSRLKLRLPEELSKESYMEYYTEWQKEGGGFVPSPCSIKDKSYDEWLKADVLYRTAPREGFVPCTSYFLADDSGYIYGMVSIRHRLNEKLMLSGGHIGYGIRPTVRKKGYGKLILALALNKIAEMGYKKALVTCDKVNIGSASIIETNGGMLENVVLDDGEEINRYWINTAERSNAVMLSHV